MDTDRELLELAAKAAGIEIQAACDGTCCIDMASGSPCTGTPSPTTAPRCGWR